MRLCECGCEQEVKSKSARYLPGHHNRDFRVKEKKRLTCIKNYGVENPSKNKSIQQKKKDTCLEKYGVESHNQSEIVKEKKRLTCLKNYDVENPNQSEIVKEKKRKTCIDHFDVEYPSQSQQVLEKRIETYKKHYGEEHHMHNDEFKQSFRKIFIEKYGVENPSQLEEVKQRKIETEKEHFGMPFCQTFEFRLYARENLIQMHRNQKNNREPLYPLIGKYEKSCLDILEDIIKFKIDRNIQLIGYFPDGYIKELNLVIEFDEEHHNWTYQKNIDIKKDLDYNKVGLNVIRIKKVDWDKDQNKCIQEFCAKIRDLEISPKVPSRIL